MMSSRAAFAAAVQALTQAHEGAQSLCHPFLNVLPVSGAAVSTIGGGLGASTLCASDDTIARLDEIQLDLGEGPCWDAFSTKRPVIHSNFRGETHPSWPLFVEAVRDYNIGALFAFPLALGTLHVGAVDLYSTSAHMLSVDEITDASALADIAAWQVLRRVLSGQFENNSDKTIDNSPGFSRQEVHQATGMIIAQLNVPAEDALLLLRAHAFSSDRTVREVAHDIVTRQLDFSFTPP